jgi:hypothetical protein
VVGFDLVMLWLLEVPLLSFVLAPEWTPRAIEHAKVWVGRHSQMFAVSEASYSAYCSSSRASSGLI